jgi:2-amino-4-hydroxy-6-hydroxymethyldihydropteridine diphosphokinase
VTATSWVRAYIGMGSNLEEPVAQIGRACRALARLPRSRWVGRSSLYRSRPLGGADQPDYINAVSVIDTALDAEALLSELQAIEAAQGRQRGPRRWSSRTLDLDLLLYGTEIRRTERLALPHPGIAEREFVLYPLHELDPTLVIPGLGAVSDHISKCPLRGLQRLEGGS